MERDFKRVTEAPSDVARQQAKELVMTVISLREEQKVLSSELRKKLEDFKKENSGHVDKIGRDIVSLEDAAKRIVGSRAFRAMLKDLKQKSQDENKKLVKSDVLEEPNEVEEDEFAGGGVQFFEE